MNAPFNFKNQHLECCTWWSVNVAGYCTCVTFSVGPEGIFECGRTDNAFEVDPECIKKTVQSILQQMTQLERERVISYDCT